MDQADVATLFVVASVVVIAAATDLWKFKVYNALTFPALFSGLAVSAVLGGMTGLASSLLGAALGFGTLVVFFAMGGVGAGDVKLMTALGAWLGPYLILQVFLASALAAGLYALVLVVMRGGMSSAAVELTMLARRMISGQWAAPVAVPLKVEVHRSDRRRRLVPFAAMTCLGAFATYFRWSADLDDVWPPYAQPRATIAAVSTLDPGGIR